MERVWLTGWEWDCCGDPFTVGDRIDLNVSREVRGWFTEMLGPELADSLDAIESHHDEPGPDRLTGTVTAIHAVTLEHAERREPRPDHPPLPEPVEMGEGVWLTIGPRDPWVTVIEPIPGTAALVPAPGVPWHPRDDESASSAPRGLNGYFVDLDRDTA
ncbi:hypothetical protein K0817_006655 [Microbacterium sp. HD4P20]|uniref:DUF6578 domain-containing protein n=1 Tax=Microbacterium sp. HD4P20 TaxID=2864874 RepID=UPI001C640BD7|nr:DUF6578 domain-containing protein [Microbacterium sp. HD4P20]MCP2636249.1 hypothetical protein [Microbacterium sp. HD4P20]